MQTSLSKKHERGKMAMTVAFAVICIVYLLPILIVLMNSFKSNAAVNTETFALPNADSFVGFQNYVKGMTFGNYPFVKAVFYSLFITLVSSALILLCTSMAAWYVSRVGSLVSKIVYYLCVFSMVVPFQMVMYTLARTADRVHLNTPWTIPVVYLGFGAGLAVFMFTGFVKSLPLEIEEAAAIAAYLRQSGATQEEAAALLVQEGWTVARTERYVEEVLQTEAPKEKKNRRPLLIRDIRFFLNSLDHSLAVMRSAGVDAKCHRAEEGEDLLLTIRIPRARPPAG